MQPWQTPQAVAQVTCMLASYSRWTGQDLLQAHGVSVAPRDDTPERRASMVFALPCVVVAHGVGEDPIFVYANATALGLWELDWGQFTRLPSRRSAEASEVGLRSQWLARATSHGYVTGCSGIRISASGRRFHIEDVTIWNLVDVHGAPCGQGATYRQWTYL
jgi:hypothetical protein